MGELARDPLIVFMEDEFFAYGGAILEPKECLNDDDEGATSGHFMLLVGDERSGRNFWLLSNSFGLGWGEAGYLRLSQAADHCIRWMVSAGGQFAA